MEKIFGILEKLHEHKELREQIVPLFLSDPGMGKTQIINQFAKSKGRRLFEFITSQRNPFEISGMAIPDHSRKRMSIYDYDMLEEMEDGDILFLDETLNGNPVTLNACLTFIESRRTISGKDLKDIIIVAAANPQGAAPITPQVKERFVFYECKFSRKMWKEYLVKKYNFPNSVAYKLCDLVEREDYISSKYNFYSPRSIDKAIDSLIRGMDSPYEKALSYILNDYKVSVPHNTEIVNEKNETVFMSGGMDDLMSEDIQIGWLDLMKLKYK